jgi:hypothetical protein
MFLLLPQVKLSKRLDVARAAEQVLNALRALLETVPDAAVQRNYVLPEKIPDGGMIILAACRRGSTFAARRTLPPGRMLTVTLTNDLDGDRLRMVPESPSGAFHPRPSERTKPIMRSRTSARA